MAGDLATMKARIADEIARADLTSQIATCITDAITIYQKKRLRFSDNTFTFNTVASQEYYTSADNANIPTLYNIDYLVVQIGTSRFKMAHRTPEDIELLTQSGTQQGTPQEYAYFQQKMRFYPVPNAIFPMICAGVLLVAAPASDAEASNPWMLDAERLIRCRAKFELAVHYTKDIDLASAMNPESGQTAEVYSELKAETNMLTGTGRVRPTAF